MFKATTSFASTSPPAARALKTIEKRDDEVKKADDEINVYSEEDHFIYAIPEIRELPIELQEPAQSRSDLLRLDLFTHSRPI